MVVLYGGAYCWHMGETGFSLDRETLALVVYVSGYDDQYGILLPELGLCYAFLSEGTVVFK
jgi:hypothetical protein